MYTQEAEVRALMKEIDAVHGVSKVQLAMATALWYQNATNYDFWYYYYHYYYFTITIIIVDIMII